MSKEAAFRATYSDLKFVKSRKVAQIVLELPIEQADAFVSAFGAPNPASETWCAIARLKPEAKEAPARQKRSFAELPASQQAAMRCNEPGFWSYLAHRLGDGVTNAEKAAEIVRAECYIDSRRELDTDRRAAARWKAIDDAYWGWTRGLE